MAIANSTITVRNANQDLTFSNMKDDLQALACIVPYNNLYKLYGHLSTRAVLQFCTKTYLFVSAGPAYEDTHVHCENISQQMSRKCFRGTCINVIFGTILP